MNQRTIITAIIAIVVIIGGISFLGGDVIGGTSNMDTLALSENLTVTGTASVTGATTLATTTVSGEIQAQGLISGGSVTSASSTATGNVTLTAAQICDNSILTVTPTAGAAANLNITTAATSTLVTDCFDSNGDTKTLIYRNLATAATTTTIVAGNGITLMGATSTSVVVGQNGSALITFIRYSANEIVAIVNNLVDKD